MLPKLASLSQPRSSAERRGAGRRVLELGFDAIERSGATRVLIMDVSTTGTRIQTSARFQIGEKLELVLPEAGHVAGTIVRESYSDFGVEFGVAFDQPITAAAVSAVQLAAPAPAPPVSNDDKVQRVGEARDEYRDVQPISNLVLVIVFAITAVVIGGFLYAIGFLTFSQ